MSKTLKTVALVVGVAALAVTGIGLAVGAVAFTAAIGISATALAAGLSLASGVIGLAAGLLAKKPKLGSAAGVGGSQLDFIADPTAGEPYVMGNARVGMDIVHQASWGDKNRYLGMVGILSCAGPIQAYSGFYADETLIAFSAGAATGYYAGFMNLQTQLGATPEASALGMTIASLTMPDWGAAYKLSGLAAAGLILTADVDAAKIYAGGLPKMSHQIQGVKAYDPRLDSTNGGSGAQRPLTESTYAYSENPWVHAGTYALGRFENGYRIIGPGLPANKIEWASFIEAANVASANNWKISGRIMSTDSKWEVLKAIGQAGGGAPMPSGAMLGCIVNTPRVSLETIEESDVRGSVSAPQMAMRRDRINGAIPRFRSADHAWEVTPGNTVRNATYLAADGGERTREVDLLLVADVGDGLGKTQAAQLAAYEVANSRERVGISVELGLVWSQYKVGDCLTLNLPSARLNNAKAVVIGRTFNAERNTVTLEFRTETDAKHTWALGLAGTTQPPPTIVTPPGTGDGVLTLAQIQTQLRATFAAGSFSPTAIDAGSSATIQLHGSTLSSNFTIDYPNSQDAVITPKTLTGKAYNTTYFLYADVHTTVGPGDPNPTFGADTVYANAINSTTHPYRFFLGRSILTPTAGGTGTSGGGAGAGGFDPGGGGGAYYP